jgi:hypothetical protein
MADFDTKIAVTYSEPFRGVITCNDDAVGCSHYSSKTPSVFLHANETYYVMIGGFDDWEVGSGVLTIGQTTKAPTSAPTPRWTGPTAQPSAAPTGPTPSPSDPLPPPGITCDTAIPLSLGDNSFRCGDEGAKRDGIGGCRFDFACLLLTLFFDAPQNCFSNIATGVVVDFQDTSCDFGYLPRQIFDTNYFSVRVNGLGDVMIVWITTRDWLGVGTE